MAGKINNLRAIRVVIPPEPSPSVTQRETNAGIARNWVGGCGQVTSLLIWASSAWLGLWGNLVQSSRGEERR